MAQTVNNLLAMQETWVQSLGREEPPGKEKATHSSALAWVRKNPQGRKRLPTPVLLPRESMDRGAWRATILGVAELDMTEQLIL